MKKQERLRLTFVLLVLALLTVVCASGGDTSSSSDPISAIISEISGKVQVLKASVGEFQPAAQNTSLEVNDQVLTGEDGRVKIDLSDGTIIRLSPLSNFVLEQIGETEQDTLTRLQLNIGRLWIILKGGQFIVDTPSGVASVRGSYLHVWVDPINEFTNVTCLEGICSLGNNLGTVELLAGQTAVIKGFNSQPQAGKMTHEDVSEWLAANPEATLVVVPLTATVEAGKDAPLPEAKTNTPTPTATIGPSATPSATATPTKTLLSVDCGPPLGWVLHTVRSGETLESLSYLYRVSQAELQKANCRGDMTFIVPGEKLYVPNVATSTPTFTPTPTKTQTPTAIVTGTVTGGGSGGPTATNSPTTFSGPVGPDKLVISSLSLCPNPYKIQVSDPDGITEVKMIYTFDNSLPMRDTAVSAGKYVTLPLITGNQYGVSGKVIDTTGVSTPVTIKFRFSAVDKLGNLTYFPAGTAYTLTDQVNCSAAATFSNEGGPSGITISSPGSCEQLFTIDASDPDGIIDAKLLYNVDGATPNWGTSVAAGDYYTLSKSGSTYSISTVIDSSVGSSNEVHYVYAVKDSLGNIYHYPKTGHLLYTDNANCGETTGTVNQSPDAANIATTAACNQVYSVDAYDANGISKVEVLYTISDTSKSSGGGFVLSTSDNVTYAKTQSINSTTGTFATPYTVTFDIKVTDTLGHSTFLLSNGSFTADVLCP